MSLGELVSCPVEPDFDPLTPEFLADPFAVMHSLPLVDWELVAAKAADRGDDFTSALLAIHDERPDQLTQEEIASILFSVSFAGHETTNYLIGNALRRLLEVPSRWEEVIPTRR